MKTIKDKLQEMLNLQDAINVKISEDWRNDHRPWYRAIWIELAEFMGDHIGYKWWKHEETDFEQAQIELIDIFHFGLSDLLNQDEAEVIAGQYASVFDYKIDFSIDLDVVRELTEEFVLESIKSKHFDINLFVKLSSSVGLSFDNLYRQYVGKNVLNHFRQTNGYKDGSYIKMWNGEEDNVVLARIISDLDIDQDNFAPLVEESLLRAYSTVSK